MIGILMLTLGAPGCEAVSAEVQEHFDARRYDDARRVAEEHLPRCIDLHYSLGFVAMEQERFEACVDHFGRYLDTQPPDTGATAAHNARQECTARLPAQPPPPVPPVGPTAEPKLPPPPPQWHDDPTGWGLSGVGLAAVGTGLALWLSGRSVRRSADNAELLQAQVDQGRLANRLRAAGFAVGSVGIALIVGGIIRFAVVGARYRRWQREFGDTSRPPPTAGGAPPHWSLGPRRWLFESRKSLRRGDRSRDDQPAAGI